MTISRRRMLLGTAASASLAAIGGPLALFSDRSTAAPAWSLPAKRAFKIIENEWIPMPDGVRLAARFWIPEGAETHPVPVVFEYLPYRLWDDLRWRDDKTGENLAPYGVAFVRVDIRGTGNSEGVMVDEYDVPGIDRWRPGHRLARQAILVEWIGGHAGHFLGRNQCAADRRHAASRAQGHHAHGMRRRPLHRRCPLHGRRLRRAEHGLGHRLQGRHGGAAGSASGGRRSGSRCGASAWKRRRRSCKTWSTHQTLRCLLEARLHRHRLWRPSRARSTSSTVGAIRTRTSSASFSPT